MLYAPKILFCANRFAIKQDQGRCPIWGIYLLWLLACKWPCGCMKPPITPRVQKRSLLSSRVGALQHRKLGRLLDEDGIYLQGGSEVSGMIREQAASFWTRVSDHAFRKHIRNRTPTAAMLIR